MEASKKFQSLHSKPCLMQIENILETILTNRILKPLTEYELIKILQQEHFLLTDFSMKKANELFAAHFILFHTLYRLRKRWIYHQSYLLEISSLKIQLLPFVGVKGHAIDKQDLLQIYYLDINNLHQTTEQDVVEIFFRLNKEQHGAILKNGTELWFKPIIRTKVAALKNSTDTRTQWKHFVH